MTLIEFKNPQEFYAQTKEFLEKDEVTNNLLISIANRLYRGQLQEEAPKMFAVKEAGTINLVAVQTPPYNLILSHGTISAARFLGWRLGSYLWPGVNGPALLAREFAESYCMSRRLGFSEKMNLLNYALTKVNAMSNSKGSMTLAKELGLFGDWLKAFHEDTGSLMPNNCEKAAEARIKERRLFYWNDNGPKAMAIIGGDTPSGVRIGGVYTPKEFRNKGYAGSLVTVLSQHLLNEGNKYCFLFTDGNNPTSNSVYKKIGYELQGQFKELSFAG